MISPRFKKVVDVLSIPGRRYEVAFVAPARRHVTTEEKKPENFPDNAQHDREYTAAVKSRRLDRWLDKVVAASGSQVVYFAILTALITWAFLGIRFGGSATYMIVISDAQAIVNMVFDAFLMRQQLNSCSNHLIVAACLRSRAHSHERMIKKLVEMLEFGAVFNQDLPALNCKVLEPVLPRENWLGRVSTVLSGILGHIITVFGFCLCVVVWLAFGHHCHWSSQWQLYMNSATSALMVFMLAFIANIRERHSKYTIQCLKSVSDLDVALEARLRMLTGDQNEHTRVVIPPLKQSKVQRAIDYYADLVGTLTGVVILTCVLVVWVAIGPAMDFSSNWWLLIGTYAGLVGLNDSFVLRNVSAVLDNHADEQFKIVAQADQALLRAINEENEGITGLKKQSFWDQLSLCIGCFCAHELMVVSGLVLIVCLIIGASAMHWSLTGQLLCNVPPSIIESFFTMILLTGHNIGEEARRTYLWEFYHTRLKLTSQVDTMIQTGIEDADLTTKVIEGT